MYILNRIMAVNHHPPHIWEPINVSDTLTLNEINSLRYTLLEYKHTDGSMWYKKVSDIPQEERTVVATAWLPTSLTKRLPRMAMFVYDNLRNIKVRYSLDDIPGRHEHNQRDIVVDGMTRQRNHLFMIGGLIHRTHYGRDTYIIDGGTTARKKLNIAALQLPDCNTWDVYDINSTMLRTAGDYIDDCTIVLERPPGPGEIPVFIIGGYLVPLGDMITPLSTDVYRIELNHSNYINRLIDNDGVMDVESAVVDGVIDVAKLRTNLHIKSVMDISQTFVLYVKAEATVSHIYPVSQTSIPGRYLTSHRPVLPMITGHGNVVDYATKKNGRCYTVYTNDERIKRRLTSPDVHNRTNTAIDPSDLIYRRTAWHAVYVEVR